jgi:lipid-A-disaccharide synthase
VTGASKSLFIICGEPSGEAYAAQAARAFRTRFPSVPMEGIGGLRLEGEGVRILLDYHGISVVGFTEVLRHLPAIAGALLRAVRFGTRPDVGALLLVDFPDFNFRVGKRAHRKGIPVVYYIPPQLWAWRAGRARDLAAFTKGVVVPFPFEEPILKKQGVNAVFAGHPLLDELWPWLDMEPDPERLGIPRGATVVGLLPGSRSGEIRTHLPLMASAAVLIRRRFPDVHFAVPLAAPRFRETVESELKRAAIPVTLVEKDRHLLFGMMTTALAASGTATLELALMGVPSVIVYRTSTLTYRIGRRLAAVSSIGLPNIVAGEPFLPELVQSACRPDRMAEEAGSILADGARRRALRARCLSLRDVLRGAGPSDAVVDMLAQAAGDAWE